LQRTPRGRVLTRNGYAHIGLAAPAAKQAQIELIPLADNSEEEIGND
jgi:hypothetical protein